QLLEKAADADRPQWAFQDDSGLRHCLWTITDRAVLQDLTSAMEPKPLFIADGHHRYETALTYRRSRQQQAGHREPKAPYDNVLMLISSLEDPGLTVLPTHRVLRVALPSRSEIGRLLGETFEIVDLPFQHATEPTVRKQFLRSLHERGESRQVFGLALRDHSAY